MVAISGGKKLEQELAAIARALSSAGTLRVGFLENATYPDGKPVAMIAVFQNYGTRTIPPRPFFTNMVADKSPTWGRALALNLRGNGYNASRALAMMGLGISGQLRQSIRDTNSPPLAQSTIDRKGHSKPLVDSGHMLGSIDFDVR